MSDTPINPSPVLIDNTSRIVRDDLAQTIRAGGKVAVAAAYFSIYAYEALKEQLEQVDQFRFLFTSPTFTSVKPDRAMREFYIPRLSRERGVIGTEFEIRLRNELTQKAIARECADWIKRKAVFRSLSRQASTNEILHVQTSDYSLAYQPFHEFSTVGLGCRPGDEGSVLVTRLGTPYAEQFLSAFNKLWDDRNLAQDVTEQVIENITAVYQENSAELIYVLTLYHVFKDFLDDTDEDSLPNERVGFCQTRIWEKLYDFQRDAVLGIIHKLERYNGCILADSVGLGKTFTALAVIKYYELRNKNVLVLCPKKLQLNWSTFRQNVIHNPIQADRLRYDVLFHTDLSRTTGKSALGLPLDRLNWGNYDLVVIDESHNFRNGGDRIDPDRYRINRYNTLMEKVIRSGVQTKVLMLTATPVNNRFNDLRNQLALAYEGESEKLDRQLSLSSDVNTVFRQAQQAYNEWVRLPLEDRTTEALLKRLDMDFFTLLDSVTIARSRRHIRRYYDMTKIGSFPKRLPPISVRPKITDLPGVVNYSEIYDLIDQLKLSGYTPTKFIQPSKRAKYELTGRTTSNLSTEGREEGLRRIMAINLLKRLESSIHSFRTTLQRVRETFRGRIEAVSAFEKARRETVVDASDLTSIDSQLDSDDQNTELFTVSERYKVSLADMDYISWRREMVEDCGILEDILTKIEKITPRSDTKLKTLLSMIDKKVSHPTGSGNKKVLIFTAFADTAEYLYDQICDTAKKNHLHCGLVTGTKNQSTVPGVRTDMDTILTLFSPLSKEKATLLPNTSGEIDILIGTDCISEGQNLQDCDWLINYDIHWNPVRIIQRFGRIDRIGSRNSEIQLVNFWPDIELDEYIKLKERVETKMRVTVMTSTGDDDILNPAEKGDLQYRRQQLERMQKEVVDLEEMTGGISIVDMGLADHRIDLLSYKQKHPELEKIPTGIHAVVFGQRPGVIFVLKNVHHEIKNKSKNRLHPYYLLFVGEDGTIRIDHLHPKDTLDYMCAASRGHAVPDKKASRRFNSRTKDGRDMKYVSRLLSGAIASIVERQRQGDIDSFFGSGVTTFFDQGVSGLNDFELICFMVVAADV